MSAEDNRGWRAYIEPNFVARGISVSLVQHYPDGTARMMRYAPPENVQLEPHARPDYGGELGLEEDAARALYEALADHFGHSVHDVRAVRRDYDAERKRVDKLTDTLIGLVNRG